MATQEDLDKLRKAREDLLAVLHPIMKRHAGWEDLLKQLDAEDAMLQKAVGKDQGGSHGETRGGVK